MPIVFSTELTAAEKRRRFDKLMQSLSLCSNKEDIQMWKAENNLNLDDYQELIQDRILITNQLIKIKEDLCQ